MNPMTSWDISNLYKGNLGISESKLRAVAVDKTFDAYSKNEAFLQCELAAALFQITKMNKQIINMNKQIASLKHKNIKSETLIATCYNFMRELEDTMLKDKAEIKRLKLIEINGCKKRPPIGQ
jgi:hypothetical protein